MMKYALSSLLCFLSTFITCGGSPFPNTLINYGQTFGLPQASGNVVNYGQSFGHFQSDPYQEQPNLHISSQSTREQNHALAYSIGSFAPGNPPVEVNNYADLNGFTGPITIEQAASSSSQNGPLVRTSGSNDPQGLVPVKISNIVSLQGNRAQINIEQPVSSSLANGPEVRSSDSNIPQGLVPDKVSNIVSLKGNRAPITIEQPVIRKSRVAQTDNQREESSSSPIKVVSTATRSTTGQLQPQIPPQSQFQKVPQTPGIGALNNFNANVYNAVFYK